MDTQRILATINAHRRRHGAPELQWDTTCAVAAQNWANRGYFVTDPDTCDLLGESLSVSDTKFDPTTECINAINVWQQEENCHDYTNGVNSPESRRFTQNVWKGTTHVGFGFAGGAVDQYGRYWASYVVAKFFPPGNVDDEYEENVLPRGPSA